MLVHFLAHLFILSFSHPATPGTVSTGRSGSLPVPKKKTEGEKQVVMLTPGRTEGRKLAETQLHSLQVLKPLARFPAHNGPLLPGRQWQACPLVPRVGVIVLVYLPPQGILCFLACSLLTVHPLYPRTGCPLVARPVVAPLRWERITLWLWLQPWD